MFLASVRGSRPIALSIVNGSTTNGRFLARSMAVTASNRSSFVAADAIFLTSSTNVATTPP